MKYTLDNQNSASVAESVDALDLKSIDLKVIFRGSSSLPAIYMHQ